MVRIDERDLFLGKILGGRYSVIKRIGQGGMGNVYLAEHRLLKKKVAVKILHLEQSRRKDTTERFKREAIAASNLGQENIVDVTDFGYADEGNAYFVMEYVDGRSLAEIVTSEAPLPLHYVVAVSSQICLALYSAHSKGIIHRDLKPENILITKKESVEPFVKVLDFGISKFLGLDGDENGRPLTKAGAIFGTPEYMSPEQASGEDVCPQSDIYSLGILLYEMLSGRLPFVDDNFMKVLHSHQYDTPEPPSTCNNLIPPDMDAVVLKCLEKNPKDRYGTMMELFSVLKKIYADHRLDRKINLSFLFDSTTVTYSRSIEVDVEQEKKMLSDNDVMRILNDGSMTDRDPQTDSKSSIRRRALLFLTFLFIIVGAYLFLGGGMNYFRVQAADTPSQDLTARRKSVETPDSGAVKKRASLKKSRGKKIRTTAPSAGNMSTRSSNSVAGKRKYIRLQVKSNIKGVEVYEKEKGKYICKTPCDTKLQRDEGRVTLLEFRKEGYTIKPMAIRRDRDMTVTVKLRDAK